MSRFKVLSRIRPIGHSCNKTADLKFDDNSVTLQNTTYQFDQVFGPQVDNETLYNGSVRAIIDQFCNGYNGCILAYGQSGSGKTHSITGTGKQPGIVPKVVQHIFDFIEGTDAEYVLKISYLEVFAERIRNLIGFGPSKVSIRAGKLVGEKQVVVRDEDHIFQEIHKANKNRITKKTNANERSSRSHTVLKIMLEQTTEKGIVESRLDICDLAGSESADKSGSPERVKEMKYINKSLESLRSVVQILSKDHKNKRLLHVPYRNSVLTQLLEPSLSGKSNVMILCCLSPFHANVAESKSTIRFANAAKKLKVVVTKQEKRSDDQHLLLAQYKKRIHDLESDLKKIQEVDRIMALEEEIDEYQNLIIHGHSRDMRATVHSFPEFQEIESLDQKNRLLARKLEAISKSYDSLQKIILSHSHVIIEKKLD